MPSLKANLRAANAAEWAQWLEQSPGDYSLSQTFEFGAALSRAYAEYSHEPQVAEFVDGARVLLPLMRVQRRLVRVYEAIPLSLNGTPIGVAATPPQIMAAIEAVSTDRLDISGGGLADANALALPGMESSRHETHVLELDGDFERVWMERFDGKVRNQCRTAERKGVQVSDATTAEEFTVYYEMYVESTRRWGYATPPYPAALFAELASLVKPVEAGGGGVQLKLARVEGEVAAGVLLFHGRRSVLYWSGAMRSEYSRFSPNNALLQAAIREACERGHRIFDFGASGPLDTVRKFKESFGARPLEYTNYTRQSARYKLAEKSRKILTSSPLRVPEKTS